MGKELIRDQEVLAGIKAGGAKLEGMIRHVYETYFHFVKQAIRKHALEEDEGIDAYTDSVMIFRQQVISGRFRGESKISTFIYRIFFHKCIDAIRKNSTKRVSYEYELPVHLEDKSPSIARLLQIKEDFERVKGFLIKLGKPCYQIILDSGFHGYNMDEIAARIGFKDAQSVRSRKYTCMKKLFKMMGAG